MGDGTHPARAWEFLSPWFECLRWRLRPHFDPRHDRMSSDPVRVGLDVSDWWIFVDVSEDDEDEDYETAVRRIREALLLVGALARINRVYCWQFLQVVSKFERAAWMDLDDPAFYPMFVVNVTKVKHGLGLRKMRTVTTAVDGLMSAAEDNYSEEFLRDWARVLALYERTSWRFVRLISVPLRVLVDLHGVDDSRHIEYCHKIAEGIRCIRRGAASGERVGIPVGGRVVTAPQFQVKTMDLYLGEIRGSVDIFQALQQLVDLDIPLNIVELPTFEQPSGVDDWMESRLAWCDFLRSLTGQVDKPTHALSRRRVRRIVVPPEYGEEPLRSSFFSALVGAREIEELDLKRASRTLLHGEHAQTMLWVWVASVALGDASAPATIKTLSISGEIISMSMISSFADYQSLVSLVNTSIPQVSQTLVDKKIIQQRIMVPPGTELDVHTDQPTTFRIKTNGSLDAIAVFESCEAYTFVLVVPGIGICSTRKTSENPATPDQPTMANDYTSSLVNLRLELSMSRNQQSSPLKQLVQVVGGERLRGLHVDLQLDEFLLFQVLESCPNLESASLCLPRTSRRSLLDHDSRGSHVKIKSLHLLNIGPRNLPETTQLLVDLKLSEIAAANAIERVCLTVKEDIEIPDPIGLLRPRTPANTPVRFHGVIPQLLRENTMLTHFWCLYEPSRSLVGWAVERHHGQVLTRSQPHRMEPSAVLAFLHVLDQTSDGCQRPERLDDGVKALILSFAAEQGRRSIVCEDPFKAGEFASYA